MSNIVQKHSKESLLPDFFNRVFGSDFFGNFFEGDAPSINIKEKKNEYELEVSAPGYDKKDFEVKVDRNILTIMGESSYKNEEKDKDSKVLRREFSSSSFSRSFTLPENIDADNIEVKHKNGILDIKLPKLENVAKHSTKKIEIK